MGFGAAPREAARGGAEGVIQRGLVDAVQSCGLPIIDALSRHVADARVPVRGVVPGKQYLAVGACVLDAVKVCGEG